MLASEQGTGESALADDRALLMRAVREAGDLAATLFGEGCAHWTKPEDGSPVTEADLRADRLLRERLCGARPDYGWLSEESPESPDRLARARLWVVDPIDGTRAFLRGKPQWTVSAALVEDGRPLIGIVHNPVTSEFFEACAGEGARLNGQPIRIEDRASLDGARVLARADLFRSERWFDPDPEMRFAFRNSIAYRLCLVACGAFHAAFSASAKSDWDLAAADLVVREAGGRVTTAAGERLIYNRPRLRHRGVLVAGPRLHGLLLERTARLTRA